MSLKVTCGRCGKRVAERERGGIRAHRCPHREWCVPPKAKAPGWAARTRNRGCARCFAARQLLLPLAGFG